LSSRAKAKRPASAKRSAGHALRTARGEQDDLAIELYATIRFMLKEFDFTPTQQKRAFTRASLVKSPPRISGPVLRDSFGVGDILSEWSRAAPYLGGEGKPRVLPITGNGATFESLARRFLPHKTTDEAVALACATAEVVTLPGNSIALIGNILVNVGTKSESRLAHAIRQIDRLCQTILHNSLIHVSGIRKQSGHMERAVHGVIARSAFKEFMQELRPQIDDLLHRVDSSMEVRKPQSLRSMQGATAVSVSVYVSQETDLERAGVDTQSTFTSRARQKSKKKV
jgi:hypothetical protein